MHEKMIRNQMILDDIDNQDDSQVPSVIPSLTLAQVKVNY
jgi:hypothetical protein